MPVTNSDSALWYDVGIFGELGYAVPNPSDDFGTLNPTIEEFVSGAGSQLFVIMHHPDADMRSPPRLNTLMRIHRLYLSCSRLLNGRMVPSNELDMEAKHIQSGAQVFRLHPCPYFQVRNPYLRRWAGYTMLMLSEAMQHTENRRPIEISQDFAGLMAQYLRRIYHEMSIELFGKMREEVREPTFLLQDADFKAYNPADSFPSTEALDTVPSISRVLTEDQLAVLRNGIPTTQLPNLKPWPTNLTEYYEQLRPGGLSPAAVHTAGSATGGQSNLTPDFDLSPPSGNGGGTATTSKKDVAPILPDAPLP